MTVHKSSLSGYIQAWTGHCAMAHAPPFDEHRRPFEKNLMIWGHLPPPRKCSVLGISSCSENPCSEGDDWKRSLTFCMPEFAPAGKNPAGAHDCCWWHSTAPKTPSVRLSFIAIFLLLITGPVHFCLVTFVAYCKVLSLFPVVCIAISDLFQTTKQGHEKYRHCPNNTTTPNNL